MSDNILRGTVTAPSPPAPELLEEARTVEAGRQQHDRFVSGLPCLQAIEYHAPPAPARISPSLRIAAWNAERLKYHKGSAALLRDVAADVILLSELDVGMARSGNRHSMAELAHDLNAGYAYGVEYVELGLGDEREKAWHAGQANAVGLHGNGIVSFLPLADPVVIRLDEGARWFAGAQTTRERRIGWRMAIGATLRIGSQPVFVASVHLESSTDAADRAAQVDVLIKSIERLASGMPAVIGGDFNTAALPIAGSGDEVWFASPQRYEPLFAVMRAAGYEWQFANSPVVTERTRPDGTPEPPFRRIDWLFTRGLEISDPQTVPAVDDAGAAISDHELIALTAKLRTVES